MINFGVLICTLAALSTTEAGSLKGKMRKRVFASSFSAASYPVGVSGVVCLNGGSEVTSLFTGEHLFCLCPDGFNGTFCETVMRRCYEGVGLGYRGTVSRSESGRRCVTWDLNTRTQYMTTDINSGEHNYCRNLQYKARPWCYVRKNKQLVWEYCAIHHCFFETSAESRCGKPTIGKQMTIVDGKVATVESHPWVATIFWRRKSKDKIFRCSGTLISPCWVLTAAHCFPEGSNTKRHRFSVSLGKNALNETDLTMEQTFRVEEILIHEGFDNSDENFNNDIALVKLKAKQGRCAEESKSVNTACLPPPQQSLQPGVICGITGYMKDNYGLQYKSHYLQDAQVTLIADDVCRQKDYYGNMITDNMFCASRVWSLDACEGDSGGPLVCEVHRRFFLFGIISWGNSCARKLRPGVYTRVTNYNRWIEEKTGLSSITSGKIFPRK